MNYLKHHGILGMRWGIRRFQNADGSLTPAGQKRYGSSLTNAYKDWNRDDDLVLKKGTYVNRRIGSNRDDDDISNGYKYVYDGDNDDDDSFYSQFGSKILDYAIGSDTRIAGLASAGKIFLDTIKSIDDPETLENADIFYEEIQKRHGAKNIDSLLSMPLNELEIQKYGGELGSALAGLKRNEANDERMKKRGFRDIDTSANDVGRAFVSNLMANGYGGMIDYHDYGSNAPVNTPTVLFSNAILQTGENWINQYY